MTTAATHPPTTLKPAVRNALTDLLYRLADDSLVIGHRNSEWTGQAPILEEDIAFSSMAQDKLGHAQAIYVLLHELGEAQPDKSAFARDPGWFRCCSLVALPRGDWAFSLIRQFFVAEADMIRWTALADSSYGPLAKLARKLHGELKYHQMHGRAWVGRLAQANDDSRQRVQAAVDAAFAHALGMFEPTSFDDVIAAEAVSPREAELCKQWREQVELILKAAGLNVPKDAKPIYGGRAGRHADALIKLLDDMQKVYRIDPTANW